MSENNESWARLGPPAMYVTGATAGATGLNDGSVLLTLYGTASVSDFKTTQPVVLFTGMFPAAVAQNLLTNLDGAIMAAAKPATKPAE